MTPGLSTSAGTTYTLSFKYNNPSSGTLFPSRLRVWYGNEATAAAMTNAVMDLGVVTSNVVTTASVDLTPGAGPVYIGFELYNPAGNSFNFHVGDISLVASGGPVSCALAAPGGVVVSGVTTSSATLVWNSVPGAFDYEREVRTSGAAGSGPAGLVSAASGAGSTTGASLTGVLSPSTTYSVHVRSRCAADDPSATWSTAVSFTTACASIGVPYAQDFTAVNSFACFVSQDLLSPPDPANHPVWGRATNNWSTYGFSGASAAVFHGIGFDPNTWMFLPAVELEAGTEYRLGYTYGKAGNFNNARYGALEVWYGLVAEGAGMLTNGTMLSDHGSFVHAATPATVAFTPPTTGTYYIGFRCNGGFHSSTYTVVDDIELDEAPACAQPLAVTAVAAGDGLDLTWDCGTCTGQMVVEYGSADVFSTPGAGAAPGIGGTIASSSATSPFHISGLVPGAVYRVFVRQACGAEYGANSIATTGTTAADNITCSDAIELECGTVAVAGTYSALHQVAGLCDASTADTYGLWYAVTGDGGDFTLSTCSIAGGQASFDTRITVMTSDDCTMFTCVASSAQASGCGSVTWSTAPGAYYLIYISGHAGSGQRGTFGLALECLPPPSCYPPTDLSVGSMSASEATFAWTSSPFNTGSEHVYELRSSGAPGSGPAGLVSGGDIAAGPVSLNGLAGSSSYTFSVRADCDDGGPSEWASVEFTTPCTAAAIPYDAAFTGATIPDCYAVINANNDAFSWVGGTWAAGFTNSSVAVYDNFDGYAFTPDDWLITRAVATTEGNTYRVSLKHRLSLSFASGAVGLRVYAGTSPDPGSMVLLEDLGNVATNVVTARQVDFTATGGPLYIAFKAGANTANSGWSFALYLGDIRVDALDCEGVPNGTTVPGAPCDPGPGLENGVVGEDCECVGTPIGCSGAEITISVLTDANPEQTTWTLYDGSMNEVATGGPFTAANTLVSSTVCLIAPNDVHRLTLHDSFGDGLAGNGYWEVRDANGLLLLRDAFTTGTVSPSATPAVASYGTGHALQFPAGPASIAAAYCGNFSYLRQQRIEAEPVPGASTYQFEFADPDAGFTRRIAVPRNWVRFNEMFSVPLVPGVTYFARVRVDQGAAGLGDDRFGGGCEIALQSDQTCTGLIDDASLPTFSCGVTRAFGASDKIWTYQVPGATQYRFRFVNAASSYARTIVRSNYQCILSWQSLPLVAGTTYDVSVEAYVGGAWKGYCGPVCQLTIAGGTAPALAPVAGNLEQVLNAQARIQLWPNPNTGDQVNVRAEGFATASNTVAIDVMDLSGKVAYTAMVPVMDGLLNTVLDLGHLNNGVYMLRFTTGDNVQVERLVISK